MPEYRRYRRIPPTRVLMDAVRAMVSSGDVPLYMLARDGRAGKVAWTELLASLVGNLWEARMAGLPLAMGFKSGKAAWGERWADLYGVGVWRMRKLVDAMDGVWWSLDVGWWGCGRGGGGLSRLVATPRLGAVLDSLEFPPVLCRSSSGDDMAVPEWLEGEADKLGLGVSAWSGVMSMVDIRDGSGRMLSTVGRRVFNNVDIPGVGLSHGGRLYMSGVSHQVVKREGRKLLTVGGEAVVEKDFSAMHATMAWCSDRDRAKLSPPAFYDDPPPGSGGVDAEVSRKVLKRLFNTMLNAATVQCGVRSMRHWVNVKLLEESDTDPESGELREVVRGWDPDYDGIAEWVMSRWPWLREWFGMGSRGLGLQRVESDMMMRVLLWGVDNGVAVLPMHDGALCQSRHGDALERVMKEEFRRSTGCGFDPVVKTVG